MTKLLDINDRILRITNFDLQYKTKDQLFASLLEELGEVATELKIEKCVFGNAHKKIDEGSKGEAVDLYICCVAVFFAHIPTDWRTPTALASLEMKDTNDEDVFWYLVDITRDISFPNNSLAMKDAAQTAINIFFNTGTEEEFYEIANRKLTKWEKSQNDCIKNMATQ